MKNGTGRTQPGFPCHLRRVDMCPGFIVPSVPCHAICLSDQGSHLEAAKAATEGSSQQRRDVTGTRIVCPKSSFCQHLSESCDASVPLYFHAALSDLTSGYIHSKNTEYSLCARPCLGSGVQQ